MVMLLNRRDLVAEALADRGDALVIAGLGSPTYDVAAVSPDERNFYLWGAMGGAAMMGLGLALAQPTLEVIVVTGDGEAMMGVGGFATIAAKQPANLAILVLDNERYGETGQQSSHAAHGADLAAMAAAAGIAASETVRDHGDLPSAITRLRTNGAPRVLVAKVDPAMPPRVMPTRDAVENKLFFRKGVLNIGS